MKKWQFGASADYSVMLIKCAKGWLELKQDYYTIRLYNRKVKM